MSRSILSRLEALERGSGEVPIVTYFLCDGASEVEEATSHERAVTTWEATNKRTWPRGGLAVAIRHFGPSPAEAAQ